MRLDKYLKLSRLVKRRTVAQEMISVGAVRINHRNVKPSSDVKNGDMVEVAFPRRVLSLRVLVDDEKELKRKRSEPYELIGEKRVNPEEDPW